MYEFISGLNKLLKEKKIEFESFITNKNVPLDQRWNLWVKAPSELKNKSSSIEYFKEIDSDQIMYEGELVHTDRYQTIEMVLAAENYEWKLKYPRPTDVHEYTQEGLNRFKEEILNRNIESFIYDW